MTRRQMLKSLAALVAAAGAALIPTKAAPVAPPGDPFWNSFNGGNGCRCSVDGKRYVVDIVSKDIQTCGPLRRTFIGLR